MTDQYDDPHEHEAHAEGEQGHEPKAEAWQDDQPPVDDFADPGAEEIATTSEEPGAPTQEESVEQVRKSSSLLPIVAGLGGLFFLGAVLYWQFGHSSTPIPAVPPPPPLQVTQAQIPPTPQVPVNTDVAPKTSLAPAENTRAATPSAGTAMPAGVSNMSAPFAPAASATPASPAPGAAPEANNAGTESTDARLNTLSSRIDDLKKALDQATQQLGQMNIALASPSASVPANAGGVEDRLAKVEQQVEQMQHAAAPALAAPAPSMAAAQETGTEAAGTVPAPKPAVHKSSYHHKKSKTVARKTMHAMAAKWVLRAATPDEAWVAKDESTSDLRHVRIGDELPGIGRIKAIRQIGDSWAVEGSAGTVH